MRPIPRIAGLAAFSASALLAGVGCESRGKDDTAVVRGQGGTKLVVPRPDDVTMIRGGTAEVAIKVERRDLADEISVSFTDLPDGVEAVNVGKTIVGEEATYRLRAGQQAAIVTNYPAKVTVAAAESDLAATQTFHITVEEAE